MLPCLVSPEATTLPLYRTSQSGLEALCAGLGPAQAAWLRSSGFAGKSQELALLPGAEQGGGLAGAVLGLGQDTPLSPWSFGTLPASLPEGSAWHLADPTEDREAEAAVLGWCLGAYRFTRFKAPSRAMASLRPPSGAGADRAVIAAEAVWRARDLINTPASHLGPSELAEAVRALADAHGAGCTVIAEEALRDGFPAVHAVGAASPRAPRIAILEWGEADAPLVALCGKGVCFDTGGLDLKPSAGMLRMKKDMGGAAVVLGVAETIMRLRLPVRLLVLIGAVENAVAGAAFRPGDVLRTRAGLSVEVGNTDAEGRLVLCDLLAYAAERKPALLIDCATLTGAARVALGPDLPALFATEDALAEALLHAGQDSHDPLWRLPLHGSYGSWLDSPVADLNNVAARPMAGAIIGALFLQRFVPAGTRWVHLDLYAWNDSTRPGRPEGGEAQAMRALVAGMQRLFGRGSGPGQ